MPNLDHFSAVARFTDDDVARFGDGSGGSLKRCMLHLENNSILTAETTNYIYDPMVLVENETAIDNSPQSTPDLLPGTSADYVLAMQHINDPEYYVGYHAFGISGEEDFNVISMVNCEFVTTLASNILLAPIDPSKDFSVSLEILVTE